MIKMSCVRLSVVVLVGCWVAGFDADAAGAQSTAVRSMIVAPGRTSAVQFDVSGEPENTVIFSTLRSTATITAIALVDPSGRRVWQKSPAALGMVPRSQVRDRDRGDSINLPQIRDAASGVWRFEVESAPDSQNNATAVFSYAVHGRYTLTMHVGASSIYAGEPILVTVRPADYGIQMAGIGPITIAVQREGGGAAMQFEAIEGPRTPEGVQINNEPGTYIGIVKFEETGSYTFEARTRTIGKAGAKTNLAKGTVAVAQRVGAIKLVGLREQTPESTGCIEKVFIDFDIAGVDGERYALNLSMPGRDGRPIRSVNSFEMNGRFGRHSVALNAKELPLNEWPTKLLRVALLRVGSNEIRVVDEQLGLAVNGAGAAAKKACR